MAVSILVVDDEPDLEMLIRQRFRKRIRERELDFHFASNGREALEKIEALPDLGIVLTDINMPEMDGLTLLTRMSELDTVLKAIIVSAYGDMENIRTAMNRGAFDFITKPIDFQDLEVTLEKAIREMNALKDGIEAHRQLLSVREQLNVARRIQQAILPQTFPAFPDRPEFDIFATMSPADAVGGDFYDFFLLDNDRLGCVVGDVSGKGVPAAIFMAVSRTLLRATAITCAAPDECIRQVNDLLCRENTTGLFVTMAYAILHWRTGKVDYCLGGHDVPRVLHSNGRVEALENMGGLVLGVSAKAEFACATIQLGAGDQLIFYSDGITEAMNVEQQLFGVQRLDRVLEREPPSDPKATAQRVLAAVKAHAESARQHDDITLLCLQYN